MAADYLRYATLEQCEEIYQNCISALSEGLGTVVVSISGGGESETREVSGQESITGLMSAAMRRMSQIAPDVYAPRGNTQAPNFSGVSV